MTSSETCPSVGAPHGPAGADHDRGDVSGGRLCDEHVRHLAAEQSERSLRAQDLDLGRAGITLDHMDRVDFGVEHPRDLPRDVQDGSRGWGAVDPCQHRAHGRVSFQRCDERDQRFPRRTQRHNDATSQPDCGSAHRPGSRGSSVPRAGGRGCPGTADGSPASATRRARAGSSSSTSAFGRAPANPKTSACQTLPIAARCTPPAVVPVRSSRSILVAMSSARTASSSRSSTREQRRVDPR